MAFVAPLVLLGLYEVVADLGYGCFGLCGGLMGVAVAFFVKPTASAIESLF